MTEPDSNLQDTPTVDSELSRVAAQQAAPPPPPQFVPPPQPMGPQQVFHAAPPSGRRFAFPCGYCASRLEATDSMSAQPGTCPTCGNAITIPILDNRGRLIDPATNQIIKQDPHPVHAYAAAGHRAPQIIAVGTGNDRVIQCPRCPRQNPISANNCAGCGLPFTIDGTETSEGNSWAVASLVLGIVGIPAFCLFVPSLLAIIFGILALRGSSQTATVQSGRGMAIAGIIMGVISIMVTALFWAKMGHF